MPILESDNPGKRPVPQAFAQKGILSTQRRELIGAAENGTLRAKSS